MDWHLYILIALGLSICIVLVYSSMLDSGNKPTIYGISTPSSVETPASVPDPPYITTPIMNVDDYEYNIVFANEGERQMTQATRNLLMSSYPMDWSVQPPSSTYFEKGLANFKEAFQNPSAPIPPIYGKIDGSNMIPPDSAGAEQLERTILNTYTPKKSNELSTYDIADAKEIVDRIYSAKGKVATMKQVDTNVFTITGVIDKNPVNEPAIEEATASTEAVADAGENVIAVPEVTYSPKSMDPFFNTAERTRDGKMNYTTWTPGLERQFAPTDSMTNWY